MANGDLSCPIGGEPLTSVPGACLCGRFWMSVADVEAERRSSPPPEDDAAPAAVRAGGDGCPGCGAPAPEGAQCGFCGWRPEPGAVASSPACLVVDGQTLELPRDTPVRLGRESGFRQVDQLLRGFSGISREHVEVLVEGSEVRLRDLGSMNGTHIDGRELGTASVTRPIPLRFRLGMSVEAEIRAVAAHDDLRRWTGERG